MTLDPHASDFFFVQKITVSEDFTFCGKKPHIHYAQIWIEAKKYKGVAGRYQFTDMDLHGGHGSGTMGSHKVEGSVKIIDASLHPEIENWPTNDPKAPGMYYSASEPTWWNTVATLEEGSRSTSRNWACCCDKYEGALVHNP